jgi:hypothetical protein
MPSMFRNIAGNFCPEIDSTWSIYVNHQLSLLFAAYKKSFKNEVWVTKTIFYAFLRGIKSGNQSSKAVVSKMCSADTKWPATSSQGIHGYISVTATSMFTYFSIKEIMFVKNYPGASLIVDVFILHET